MLAHFALITEGITDQVVLKALLCGHFGRDLDINRIQPEEDATDESRQGGHGGWERVIDHCTVGKFKEIFSANQYIVIQVDTDVGQEKNFGIALTDKNGDRSESDIITSVRDVIVARLEPAFYAQYQDRILFAIAVHSLECWLLPLYAKTLAESKKTKNCANLLGTVMQRANQKYAKEYRIYEKIGKAFKKNANIQKCHDNSVSLDIFLNTLSS